MTTSNLLFPVGSQVLGRVLNSTGEPLDDKGTLASATRVPLYTQNTASTETNTPQRFFESGIKVLDLLAPLAYGSVVALIANFGVGSMVVVEELLHNIIRRQNGCVVCVGLEENDYTTGEFFQLTKELNAQDQIIQLVERTSASSDVSLQLLTAALTVAQEFRKQGREVMLVLNRLLVTKIKAFELPQVYDFARTQGVTTCLFFPAHEEFRRQEEQIRAHVDSCLLFSAELAAQRIYPAIDPLLSNSRLLESPLVTQQHRQIAAASRDLLREEQQLRISPSLTPEQALQLARARKLQRFLSQPFAVAELFTEVPGEFVPLSQTLADIQALLSGQYDALPEQAFSFIGPVAQAVARTKQQERR